MNTGLTSDEFSPEIECHVLNGWLIEPFLPYASGFMSQRLRTSNDSLLIGALYKKEPAGLAVLNFSELETESETEESPKISVNIDSLQVAMRFRGRKIGQSLLKFTEEESIRRHARIIGAGWLSNKSSNEAIVRLLAGRNWSEPKAVQRVAIFRNQLGTHAEKKTKRKQLPEGYEFFVWKDRNEQDETDLKSLKEEYNINWGLFPNTKENMPIDEDVSVGLRFRGRLAGWMILHRYSAHMTRYSSLWVNPELEGRGLGIRTALEAGRLHYHRAKESDRGFFCSPIDESSQASRFHLRRLIGGTDSFTELMHSSKELPGSA